MAELMVEVEARVRHLWLLRIAAAIPLRKLQLWAARQVRVEYRVADGIWRRIPLEITEA